MDFEGQKDFRLSYRRVGEAVSNSFLKINKLELFKYLYSKKFDLDNLIKDDLAIEDTKEH